MTRGPKHTQPEQERSSGVLLHVTSLPSPHGIGDLGPAAYRWIDLLAAAGQRWWQILPLGPVGAGNSPYQCYSAFAGYPMLISLDRLVADGFLKPAEAASADLRAGRVNYRRVTKSKSARLALAADRFLQKPGKTVASDFDRFATAHAHWLGKYVLFAALQDDLGDADWTNWPPQLARRDHATILLAHGALQQRVMREMAIQFFFFRQLEQLRQYARSKGVRIIGDMPIFVSAHSADVWTRPDLFELDANLRPKAVAGVPPDLFSSDGQRWGNPLYNWQAMRRDGYGWWIDRLRATMLQCDLIRLDHFRGFEAYWRVPASAKTARRGRWVKGPGAHFFQTVRKKLGSLPLIAEDLGVITPEVEALRDEFDFPGMRIVGEFAFSGDTSNPHLPHNIIPNSVAYTGTHDNNTVAGWYASASRAERAMLKRYAPDSTADPVWAITRLTQQSVAKVAIVAAQDLLGLGKEARMNRPGTARGNWEWRLKNFDAMPKALDRLGEMSRTYGRA